MFGGEADAGTAAAQRARSDGIGLVSGPIPLQVRYVFLLLESRHQAPNLKLLSKVKDTNML